MHCVPRVGSGRRKARFRTSAPAVCCPGTLASLAAVVVVVVGKRATMAAGTRQRPIDRQPNTPSAGRLERRRSTRHLTIVGSALPPVVAHLYLRSHHSPIRDFALVTNCVSLAATIIDIAPIC